MLQAKLANGQLVTLATKSKDKIEQMRKHEQFFCPICEEQVIVKAGTQIIPHFAHQAKSTCVSTHRGEGPYHMKGKLLLKRWLKSQHIDVKLEPYLQSIKQQPDLLITINNKKIALEYQCARIPIEVVQKRTQNYIKANIVPLWILGKNLFKNKFNQLHVSPFILQFIHQFNASTPTVLFYFCPETFRFFISSNLYLTSHYRAYHKLHIRQMKTYTFKQLVNQNKIASKELISFWKYEFQRFRVQQRYRASGEELKWRTWLYSKQIAIDQLPLYVYLPTELQFLMKVPPWNWQSRLCLDIIHPLEIGDIFTIEQCENYLQQFIYPPSYYPLINSTSSPIRQYLHHLEQFHIIEKRVNGSYYKQKKITLHKNVDTALKHDDVLINQLMYNYS